MSLRELEFEFDRDGRVDGGDNVGIERLGFLFEEVSVLDEALLPLLGLEELLTRDAIRTSTSGSPTVGL